MKLGCEKVLAMLRRSRSVFIEEDLSPINARFFRYWHSLCSHGRTPEKADIQPSQIKNALGRLVIYERVTADHFRIRLMGTKIVDRIGVDLTGRNLLDFFHYAAKSETKQDLNRVLNEPAGQFLLVKDRFTSGREARVEIVRLPLTDARGEPRFIVGCTEEIETTNYYHLGRDQPELIAERLGGCFFDIGGRIISGSRWVADERAGAGHSAR